MGLPPAPSKTLMHLGSLHQKFTYSMLGSLAGGHGKAGQPVELGQPGPEQVCPRDKTNVNIVAMHSSIPICLDHNHSQTFRQNHIK